MQWISCTLVWYIESHTFSTTICPPPLHEEILIFNSKHCQQKQARSWPLLNMPNDRVPKTCHICYSISRFALRETKFAQKAIGVKWSREINQCEPMTGSPAKKALHPLKQCSSYKCLPCMFPTLCFVMSHSWFQKICKANARINTELISKTL